MTTAERLREVVDGLELNDPIRWAAKKAALELESLTAGLDQRDDTIAQLRAERDKFKSKLDTREKVFEAEVFARLQVVKEIADLKAKLAQVEKERSEDKAYIEDLCKDLCKMEDVLGFAQDQRDKDGAFVPTLGPWLERVRDLIAAEGELGDVKERLARVESRMKSETGPNDGPCYYCGEATDSLSGNPTLWQVGLCHPDDPGKVKPHHIGCVSERLERLAQVEAELAKETKLVDDMADLRERELAYTARVEAAAQIRLELLRKCEWPEGRCPTCFRDHAKGHESDCPLAAELKEDK